MKRILFLISLLFLICSVEVKAYQRYSSYASSFLDEQHNAQKAVDNDPSTAWISNYYGDSDPGQVNEWLVVDLGEKQKVKGFLITPRVAEGVIQAFPKGFNLNYTNVKGQWTEENVLLEEANYPSLQIMEDGQTPPDLYFNLPSFIEGRYFSLGITELGQDSYGGYFAQIAEFKVITVAESSDYTQSLDFSKYGNLAEYQAIDKDTGQPRDCGNNWNCSLNEVKNVLVDGQWNCCDSWMLTTNSQGQTFSTCSDGAWKNDSDWGCHSKSQFFNSNYLYSLDKPILPEINTSNFNLLAKDPLEASQSNWAHYIVNSFALGNEFYVSIVGQNNKKSAIGQWDGNKIKYNQEQPFWDGSNDKPFMHPTFLQNGPGYQNNTDGYVYLYGWSGNWGKTNILSLARVNKNADLLKPENYRYYSDGDWVEDINQASDILIDGKNLGGMGSAIYNPVYERYFLITFAEPHYANPDQATSHLTVYEALHPWGKWKRVGRINKEQALIDPNRPRDLPQDALYNPSFNPAWIESNGDMWISYSDNHPFYSFHLGKIKINMDCLTCSTESPLKSKGNSNCDSQIDLVDFGQWLSVFKQMRLNRLMSFQQWGEVDYNCDNSVNLSDFRFWLPSFVNRL